MKKSEVGQQLELRAKSNILTIDEQSCCSVSGRSTNTHVLKPGLISENWKACHSQEF